MTHRLNKTRLRKVLVRKCEHMAEEDGFPKSMEEEFVRKTLVKPIVAVASQAPAEGAEGEEEPAVVESEDAKVPVPDIPAQTPFPAPIAHLLRLRLSTQFLVTYLPPSIASDLTSHIATIHDFTPLDAYLAELAMLKADIARTRAGDYSMKTTIEDDEIANDKRKRKRDVEEEEKKRKKNTSQGVKNLGKVNTTGMKKMSAFFKKKT